MFGFGKKKAHDPGREPRTTPAEVPVSASDVTVLRSPSPGRLLALEDVPDPVFSRGLAGPGFAVAPDSGTLTSPVAGTVVMLAETHHAVGLRTANGAEIVVHVGIDSVTLKGEGLRPLCAVGDEVETGKGLLEVDLAMLEDRLPSTITPVLVTNGNDFDLEGPFLDAGSGDVMIVRRP